MNKCISFLRIIVPMLAIGSYAHAMSLDSAIKNLQSTQLPNISLKSSAAAQQPYSFDQAHNQRFQQVTAAIKNTCATITQTTNDNSVNPQHIKTLNTFHKNFQCFAYDFFDWDKRDQLEASAMAQNKAPELKTLLNTYSDTVKAIQKAINQSTDAFKEQQKAAAEKKAAELKKAQEVAAAKRKAEQEALAKKRAEDAAALKVQQDATAKLEAEQEAARKKAAEEAAAKRKAERDAALKKTSEEAIEKRIQEACITQNNVEAQEALERAETKRKMDKEKAVQKLIAENKKAAEALYKQATEAGNNGDDQKCSELMKDAAEKGHAQAQFILGCCDERAYDENHNPNDAKTAFNWYKKAAAQNHRDAQCALGKCYNAGIGTKRNPQEANKLFKIAADQGNTDAEYMLWQDNQKEFSACNDIIDVINLYGNKKTQKNTVETPKALIDGLVASATDDKAEAQNKLGMCYFFGAPNIFQHLGSSPLNTGVDNDIKQAVGMFEKAAAQNYAPAQFNLGFCYEYGKGVARDTKTAFNLYEKAAAQNHINAEQKLIECYKQGIGTAKNPEQTAVWEKKAAAHKNSMKRWSTAKKVLAWAGGLGTAVAAWTALAVWYYLHCQHA